MATRRVTNDPLGQAIKEAFDHLRAHHSEGVFGYADLPSGDQMMKSSVLHALKEAGLIRTTGYMEFCFTDDARWTTISVG